MAQVVEWDNVQKLPDKVRPFWPGANKAHVAFQNVIQLRQFIKARPAQTPPDTRHTTILRSGPHWTRFALCIHVHRTKFPQCEYLSVLTYAFLAMKNWAHGV